MIVLHALKHSRATRVLWLLETLGQPCDLRSYDRTEAFRAPDDLKRAHPLGKSPVIEDEDRTIAESATILRYLDDTYGKGIHQPPRGSTQFWRHENLLDYVESSFAAAVTPAVIAAFKGEPITEQASAVLRRHLDFIAGELGDKPFLCGDDVTLADIQISYPIALLDRFGHLDDHDTLKGYWQRLQDQPGYRAAVDKAGPMAPSE